MHQGRQDPKSRPLAALLAVLLLAACSGGSLKAASKSTTTTSTNSSASSESHESHPPTTPPLTADDADWVGRGPQPVSGLVGVGGRIVYLGLDDNDQLVLLGLDPTTGRVVWTRPSTAASHDSGVEQHLVTDGDTVFNVEPAGANTRVAFPAQAAGALDVVAVDARTGKDIWRHPFADVITPLDKCTEAALCVWQDADGGHLDLTRLDLSTGETASEGTAAFDPLVAEDGEFAISASGDTIELTSGFGQQVVWQHPLSEMFAPNDVTPDTGWAGLHVGGVWIIWLGGADDSDGATTGIADDGTRLWTRPTRACALIPDTFDAPVMCGHLDNNLGQFVTGTVERLDPQTGTSLWTFDGGGLDLLQPDNNVVRFDATRFGFHLSSGDVGLDYASGPTGPLHSGDGWCPLFADFAIVENSNSILATSWAPCTLAVGPHDTPPTSVPAFAGPTVDGFGAWVEDGEVRAARVS